MNKTLVACPPNYTHIFHSCTFSSQFFQQCFENIQTKAKQSPGFWATFFHGSIPSSYSSYELFHSSTKHTLSFSLSPLRGAQGGSAQSKSFRKYQREGQGRTYTLFPSLHLFPCLSLPLLHSSLLVPFTIHLSSFLFLTLKLVSIPPGSELCCKPGHVPYEQPCL